MTIWGSPTLLIYWDHGSKFKRIGSNPSVSGVARRAGCLCTARIAACTRQNDQKASAQYIKKTNDVLYVFKRFGSMVCCIFCENHMVFIINILVPRPKWKKCKTWHQYIYLARTLNCVLGSVKMDELSQGGPRPDARRVCRGARVQGGSDERVPRGQRAEGPRGSKGQEGPRAQWVQTGQRPPLFKKSNYFKMWNFRELLV